MRLLKFNLILIVVFGVGAPAAGYIPEQNLHGLDAEGV
jgi:hypothetical protein